MHVGIKHESIERERERERHDALPIVSMGSSSLGRLTLITVSIFDCDDFDKCIFTINT
jgi:hypothetical protein